MSQIIIRVITKLPNIEQSSKGKGKTHIRIAVYTKRQLPTKFSYKRLFSLHITINLSEARGLSDHIHFVVDIEHLSRNGSVYVK